MTPYPLRMMQSLPPLHLPSRPSSCPTQLQLLAPSNSSSTSTSVALYPVGFRRVFHKTLLEHRRASQTLWSTPLPQTAETAIVRTTAVPKSLWQRLSTTRPQYHRVVVGMFGQCPSRSTPKGWQVEVST